MGDSQSSSAKVLAIAGIIVVIFGSIVGPGLAGTAGAANQPSGDASTWPQDQYDDGRTGHTDGTTGPTGPVESDWSLTLAATSSPAVSPALYDGTIYARSDDDNVSAYRASDGAHIWTIEVERQVKSITVANDTLYVSGRNNVYALDPETGAEVWGQPYSLTDDSTQNEGTQIVVRDDRLYVAAGNNSFDSGHLYALNATTGTKDWRFQTDSFIWEAGVAFSNDTVYVGDGRDSFGGTDGGVYAVNATSGNLRWTKDYSVRVRASPTVDNGVVYVAKENGDLVAYDEDTGTEQWSTTVQGVDIVNSPAVADGVVYVGTKSSAEVQAFDASTGTSVWSGPYEAVGDVSSPVVVDDTVYAGGGGEAFGLYPSNGTERFTHAFGSGEPATPVVVNGTFYIREGGLSGKDLHAITDVVEPAFFDPTVTTTNSPVDEGQTLEVDAEVENTGDETATQTVELLIDGALNDSTSVTLDSGETKTVTLQWDTATGDAGDYTAAVESENDSDSVSVTVDEPDTPPDFAVTVTGANDPIEEGEVLAVSVDVENNGDTAGVQDVTLDIDGGERDSHSVTLTAGASDSITLEWDTSAGDAGDYTATVKSENDTDTVSVSVETPTTPTPTPTPTTTSEPISGGSGPSAPTGTTTTPTETPTPTTTTTTPTPQANVSGGEAVAYARSDLDTPTPTPTAEASVVAGEAVAYARSDLDTPTSSTTTTPSAATTTEAEAPGFGIVPAFVALLLAMALYRRR